MNAPCLSAVRFGTKRWFAEALVVVLSLLVWSGCPGQVDDEAPPEGLGDPCSHTDTVDALCLPGVVCVEARAGSGGSCDEIPAACVDAPCDCADLADLCGGTLPDLCFEAGDLLSIICSQSSRSDRPTPTSRLPP